MTPPRRKPQLCWAPDGKSVVPYGHGGALIETWRDQLYLDQALVERQRENGRKWGATNSAKRRDRQEPRP